MGIHPRDHVTVGIVGGGIAGLALARMPSFQGYPTACGKRIENLLRTQAPVSDSCPMV